MKFETFIETVGMGIIIVWAIALFGWWQSNNADIAAVKDAARDRGCIYLPKGSHPLNIPTGAIVSDITFTENPNYKTCGKEEHDTPPSNTH